MLSRTARVTNRDDYDRVFAKGRTVHGSHLSVRTLPDDGPARLGFIVGKRVSLRATKRNRLKRRLRATARVMYDKLPGSLTVVIAKPSARDRSVVELERELTELFRQSKLLS